MPETLVREQSAVEFFREQLVKAMQHQRVCTSAFTEFYLVNLLAAGIPAPGPEDPLGLDGTPLAQIYVRALGAARAERARLWRALGDHALLTAGFFGERLAGRLADFDYYRALGAKAYAQLSGDGPASGFGPRTFGELAGRFTEFSDLLAEVAEGTRVGTQQSVVRLYERWLHTGSRRAARLLAAQGIDPQPAAAAASLQ